MPTHPQPLSVLDAELVAVKSAIAHWCLDHGTELSVSLGITGNLAIAHELQDLMRRWHAINQQRIDHFVRARPEDPR